MKPMVPGLFSIIHFQIYKPKTPKIVSCNLFVFYFVLRLSNILYLSLSDLILASDREGINNPFIALGASVGLFMQMHDTSILHHACLLLFILFLCIIILFGVILMPFLS